MSTYEWLKLVHILSASVLFGTGVGIAFFMLLAHLSREQQTFVAVGRMVVLADGLFTAPAVLIQFISGLWLTHKLGIPYDSLWFMSVLGLFVLVGLCWLPVVWIQIRLVKIASNSYGSPEYKRLMNIWIALGVPAFLSVIVIFYLMVSKRGIDDTVLILFS